MASLQNPEQSSTNNGPPLSTPTGAAGTASSVPGTLSTAASRQPVATCHGVDWMEGEMDFPINGPFIHQTWKLTDQCTGAEHTPGCDPKGKLKAIDFFLTVFPREQLQLMEQETNMALVFDGHPKITGRELLKFFGVLMLIARFEHSERAHLWRSQSRCKCIPASNFGERTGVSRDRWNAILSHLAWSAQPPEGPEGMSSETPLLAVS